ncbi:hypothetical protein MCP1_360023 [Candidatus Terasakiella magnetica]|nr:hypothetical protein MCP1_360023 [Candidatus Terasakiella magnetica]
MGSVQVVRTSRRYLPRAGDRPRRQGGAMSKRNERPASEGLTWSEPCERGAIAAPGAQRRSPGHGCARPASEGLTRSEPCERGAIAAPGAQRRSPGHGCARPASEGHSS